MSRPAEGLGDLGPQITSPHHHDKLFSYVTCRVWGFRALGFQGLEFPWGYLFVGAVVVGGGEGGGGAGGLSGKRFH